MVQMTGQDQAVVKAKSGNKVCADCPTQNPQWASVPFGILMCLECSGVHRSLGVHISFVRSVAMDSWTDKQLKFMKMGGNDECNEFLKKHGVSPDTPIKKKYESEAAQLYKEVMKARTEGRPEPTELPKKAPKPAAGGGGHGGPDPNGMQRLPGETDQQYIARQTRLKQEAKARMAAKFGNSGMGGMGGAGPSRMQGIGSDPGYNPNGSQASDSMNAILSGFGSTLNVAGSYATSLGKNAMDVVQDENTYNSIKQQGTSFWGSLTSSVQSVTANISNPEDDGLAQLQRQVAAQKPNNSKYSGFGSDKYARSNGAASSSSFGSNGVASSQAASSSGLTEAAGLPHEDRNGMERLTGETDEQYVLRQTRIRDEARARMAAKFGNGGLSSAGPSSSARQAASPSGLGGSSSGLTEAVGLPHEDRNGVERLTGETDEQYVLRQTRLRNEARARMAAKFGGGGLSSAGPSSSPGTTFKVNTPTTRSAPTSGNAPTVAPVRKLSSDKLNSEDFFSNFGA